ncbi:hypothetical protein FS837_004851 [Tulasnella sp. UAMH 9824]|nr:hypothetical protein FS837_004851 [Tulasnella sp. UAMH 9824]
MSARIQQQQRLSSPPSPTLSKRSSKLPKADPSAYHEIPSMNDLANGLTKAGAANGSVARRRRTKRKTSSISSLPNGNGIITPSDSSSNSDPEEDTRSNFTSDSDSVTFEEWTGIMKRIVDEWEIPRKVLHSFGVIYLYSQRPENVKPIIYSLGASLAVIVPTDVLRLRSRRFEKVYEKFVGFLMRESERHTTNGVIWYMVGVIYALALLPRDIGVMAILILSWCDTAASTFGRLYGKYTWPLPRKFLGLPFAPRKSFAGFAAAVLTGAAVAIGFWGWAVPQWQGYSVEAADTWGTVSWKWDEQPGVGIISGGWTSLALVGAVTGLVSGVAEALDLGKVDDNLSLPIISGTVLWGLSKLASFFMGNGF